nr:putative ribonuclease H-like domain-containing protein [Tanacetum cinerariifolium]
MTADVIAELNSFQEVVGQNSLNITNTFSAAGPSNVDVSPTYGKPSFIDASQLLDDLDMPELEDITYSDDENAVDDIIFGATNKDLCKSFEKLMKYKFQMSSMGELTFFLGLQCKKQTVVATSSTEAEYVAVASCFAQVLWIQNQLLDYSDSPLLGVNTPRSDEDRLDIMELTVFLLPKID